MTIFSFSTLFNIYSFFFSFCAMWIFMDRQKIIWIIIIHIALTYFHFRPMQLHFQRQHDSFSSRPDEIWKYKMQLLGMSRKIKNEMNFKYQYCLKLYIYLSVWMVYYITYLSFIISNQLKPISFFNFLKNKFFLM